jgi:hypothetical protein
VDGIFHQRGVENKHKWNGRAQKESPITDIRIFHACQEIHVDIAMRAK